MKDELGGKILTEFALLRPKMYSYFTDNDNDDKKAKVTKRFVIKRKIKLQIINIVQKKLNLRIKQIK